MEFRFAGYVLDVSARELRRDGQRIELEPRAFALLLYLIENADRAVSKDELLGELWPRQIVTETALTRAVMKARRAVGDDSARQEVIRTVHGHGYRFEAPLENAQPAAAPSRHPAEAPHADTRRRRPRLSAVKLSLASVVAFAVAVALFFAFGRPAEPITGGRLAVLPVANLTEEPELGWVRVGLMSLLARMLEENGVDVVPERTVLAALAGQDIDAPPDRETFDAVRQRSGANSVLFTSLREHGGLHRLTAVLTRPDGRQIRRLMTGDSPAELAAQLANIVAGVLTTPPHEAAGRFSKVSTDPFVNELYARALDLELEGRLQDARETFRVAAAQEPELFWLRYEIALCTRDLREFDEAAEMFVELYAEAANGGDARAKIVTLNSHGIMLFKLNRYDEAEQKYLSALDIAAEREMPDETATVLVNLALVNTRQGDLATARQYYDRALATYADQGRPPSGFLLNNYAGLLLEVGDLAAARVHSEAAVAEFRQRGQRRFEAPSLNRLAKIMRRQGDLEGALERHEQALDIYRDLGDTGGVLSVRSAMTNVYRIRGDFTRASNNAVDVLERARQTDEPLLVAQAHLDYGRLLADAGRFAEATEHLEQALGIFLDSGEVPGAQTARAELAAAKLESGEISEAMDIAVGLRADALAAGNLAAESHANVLLGRVALADGDRDAAQDRFGAALASARTGGDPESTSIAGLALAELSLADGRVEDAVELIEEIRPFAAGRIDFRRLDARVALAVGDVDRAAAIMGELRRQAGEAWTAEDEALLVDLQERAGG